MLLDGTEFSLPPDLDIHEGASPIGSGVSELDPRCLWVGRTGPLNHCVGEAIHTAWRACNDLEDFDLGSVTIRSLERASEWRHPGCSQVPTPMTVSIMLGPPPPHPSRAARSSKAPRSIITPVAVQWVKSHIPSPSIGIGSALPMLTDKHARRVRRRLSTCRPQEPFSMPLPTGNCG
jgi:hypothetical protein